MPTSTGGVPYRSITPGASPDNPIPSPNPPSNPTPLNPTGEPLPGTSSGARAKLMRDEYDEKEKVNKKESEQLAKEKEKQEREYEKKKKAADKKYRRNAGVEIPKQGLHRFGHAEEGMTSSKGLFGFSMQPSGEDYSDAFSTGGADLFGGGSGRGQKSAGAQMNVNFGRMNTGLGGLNIGFGGLGNAMKQDGKARGFGGYRDPFAGSAPKIKKGYWSKAGTNTRVAGKKPGGKKPKRRKPSLGGGSIFNLRLF